MNYCIWLTGLRCKRMTHINSYQCQVETSNEEFSPPISQSLQPVPCRARPQLCRPLGRHHPCTEGAAEAALTGAASESGIMTHSFTPGPQETLTTSPAKCEPGGEELKRTQWKVQRNSLGHASTHQRCVTSHAFRNASLLIQRGWAWNGTPHHRHLDITYST